MVFCCPLLPCICGQRSILWVRSVNCKLPFQLPNGHQLEDLGEVHLLLCCLEINSAKNLISVSRKAPCQPNHIISNTWSRNSRACTSDVIHYCKCKHFPLECPLFPVENASFQIYIQQRGKNVWLAFMYCASLSVYEPINSPCSVPTPRPSTSIISDLQRAISNNPNPGRGGTS